ncbi:hypothetical protein A3K71_02465 [archaeon RBG_16_50_20]|nr:MAG: hypothetical protein A3K71_02465 [archaeon RBG_16_50_20]
MTTEPIRVEGDFPVYFRYTVGVAGEKFFREIMENGRLMASRCSSCNLNYLPPRIYCERCMSRLEEYVPVENEGTVEAFTITHQDAEGNPLQEPVGVALVRFPGAYGGLVHRTIDVLAIGDRVRAVFKDKKERTGSILDIKFFEKIS